METSSEMKWVQLKEFTATSEGEERLLAWRCAGDVAFQQVVWRRHVDGMFDPDCLKESGGCWESEWSGEVYVPTDDLLVDHYILSGFTPPPVPE